MMRIAAWMIAGAALFVRRPVSAYGQQTQSASVNVPSVPPDSVPYALFKKLGWISPPHGHGAAAIRSMISVSFLQATQRQKQAAVDSVRGVVVGGVRWGRGSDDLGQYLVQVPGDSWADIEKACAIGTRQPGVFAALPLISTGPSPAGEMKADSAVPRPDTAFARVPATAPAHIPEALLNSLGTFRAPDDTSIILVRSMLRVLFKGGTAQPERQQAIDLIGGVVVGGYRMAEDDGEYFVRIPGRAYPDIQAAVRKLDALPQILIATPFFLWPNG